MNAGFNSTNVVLLFIGTQVKWVMSLWGESLK